MYPSRMNHPGLVFLSVVSLFLLSDLSFSSSQISGGSKAPKLTVPRLNKGAVDPSRVKRISWRPRAFVYKGFLTDKECDHIMALARGQLEKSTIIDEESGENIESVVRTSSGMFLNRKQDEIITGIEERIAAWTFLPLENGEPIQVLRYEIGQQYTMHSDFFEDGVNDQNGGDRTATVLMYLTDVAFGGETVFPESMEKDNQPKDDSWSDCAKLGYAVKPKKGDALLFFGLYINATTGDPDSEHASCPVIKGEKWSATKWIRVRPFLVEDTDDL